MTAIHVTFADGETLELVPALARDTYDALWAMASARRGAVSAAAKLRAAIDSPVLKAPTFDEKETAAVRAALELAG